MTLPALLANYVHFGNGSSTGYYAVTAWAALTSMSAGVLRRQSAAPSVGNERVFVCIVAGTTLASEPTWTVTRGAKTAEAAGPTWQECTGQPATNGDLTNTYTWTASKAAASTPSLGVIVKDASNNLFICTTSGAVGVSEPTWDTTVGNTTTDSSAVWTCIRNGAYGNWAAPHARLANAFASTWGSAGDTFYRASAHAETQSSTMTITNPGTAASQCLVLTVNAAGSMPPVSADITTGATVSTTGNSDLVIRGSFYDFGCIYTAGNAANSASLSVNDSNAAMAAVFENCSLRLGGSGPSTVIAFGTANNQPTRIDLVNTTLSFAATSQYMRPRGRVTWRNTPSALLGTVPTTLLINENRQCDMVAAGVDLSAAGSGKNLVSVTQTNCADFKFLDCKTGVSVAITTGSVAGPGGVIVRFVNSDSADTNHRYYYQDYCGTITQETTIVRTGGASDGTTTFSRKMVTTANSKWFSPLESPWFYFWNETTGSPIAVEVETVTDGVTLNSADSGLELEALTTSGFPLGGFVSGMTSDVLVTGTNHPTSSETWTTTGLSSPVKQTHSTSITPQEKGWIRARLKLARPSTTLYACPKVAANTTQYMTDSGDIVNVPAGGSSGIPTIGTNGPLLRGAAV